MVRSIDGAECPHGVNVFDPRGCERCTLDARRRNAQVAQANGHVPKPEVFDKLQPQDTD